MESQCEIAIRRKFICSRELAGMVYFEKTDSIFTSSKVSGTRRRLNIREFEPDKLNSGQSGRDLFLKNLPSRRGSYRKHHIIRWDSTSFLVNYSKSILKIGYVEDIGDYETQFVYYNRDRPGSYGSFLHISQMCKLGDHHFMIVDPSHVSVFQIDEKYPLKHYSFSHHFHHTFTRDSKMVRSKKNKDVVFAKVGYGWGSRIIEILFDEENVELHKKLRNGVYDPIPGGRIRIFQGRICDFVTFLRPNKKEFVLLSAEGWRCYLYDVKTRKLVNHIGADYVHVPVVRGVKRGFKNCMEVFGRGESAEFAFIGCTNGHLQVFHLKGTKDSDVLKSCSKPIASLQIHHATITKIIVLRRSGYGGLLLATIGRDLQCVVVNVKFRDWVSGTDHQQKMDFDDRVSFLKEKVEFDDDDDDESSMKDSVVKLKFTNSSQPIKCFFSNLM